MRIISVISLQLMYLSLLVLWSPDSSGQSGTRALMAAEMTITEEYLEQVDVQTLCSSGELEKNIFAMKSGDSIEFPLELDEGVRVGCQLLAAVPDGYTAHYQVTGGAAYRADHNGCQFSRIAAGQNNVCRITISQDPVTIQVYKEWIGGSGEEDDVTINLSCESGNFSGERRINEGSPGGWEIRNIDPDGVLCNVSEAVRETFRPDIIDCQGLLILPGKGEECTMVNTKIVKRIEMLNRYGKILMILLVLAVGLVAVKRLS